MLTKKELNIFSVFQNNIFKEYTFQEIKNLLNEKSNNAIIRALKKFNQENLIIKKSVGKNFIYKVNFKNDLVSLYWEIYNNENYSKLFLKSIKILKNELNSKDIFYSLILFGSYSNGKFTRNSDIDMMIFIQDEKDRTQLEPYVENSNTKSLIDLDIHIITLEEFKKMIEVDYENLGKEILRNHKPILNSNLFYKFLRKELKSEFKL